MDSSVFAASSLHYEGTHLTPDDSSLMVFWSGTAGQTKNSGKTKVKIQRRLSSSGTLPSIKLSKRKELGQEEDQEVNLVQLGRKKRNTEVYEFNLNEHAGNGDALTRSKK